jgi:endo-1,4-beta-xylanase
MKLGMINPGRAKLASYGLAILLIGFSAISGVGADKNSPTPAGKLPEIKQLPNPFTFADGAPVRNQDDWWRRRQELKELFQDYMYGHLPAKSQKITIDRGAMVPDSENQLILQDLELKLAQGDKTLTMHVRVALPQNAKDPVPVIVRSGFGRRGAPTGKSFTPFTQRGYAVAECSFQEVALDNKDRARTAGIYSLFGETIDCGALMAWAWAVSRVVDALETVDKIDARKVIVTGHSRYGKAALVAGAFDERIALTVPSHSGCAGCSPYRYIYGKSEQLHNIVGAFPHWFRPNFNQFVGNVERLPVDQHLLIALVAPRALLATEGTQDTWINPEGSQLTHLAAKKVYDFLNAGDKISIRFRPVGHIPSNEDLLDFADHIFFKKKLPPEFGQLPYKEEKNGFSWDMPK